MKVYIDEPLKRFGELVESDQELTINMGIRFELDGDFIRIKFTEEGIVLTKDYNVITIKPNSSNRITVS